MIIYKLTNRITGLSYIGQTSRKLEDRLYGHFHSKSNSYVSRAIQKYGKDAFEISILQSCKSLEDLNLSEQFWIKELNTMNPFGYNLDSGGSLNKTFSQSTKTKMSEKAKQRTGILNSFYKKSHNLGSRKLQSDRKDKYKKKVFCHQTGLIYESLSDAARSLNLYYGNITKVLLGKRKSTCGFTFEVCHHVQSK